MAQEISKITLPSGTTYDIKDATARSAIANIHQFEYMVCTEAGNTPKDVQWKSGSTTITGTLVAASTTMYKIYLVPDNMGTHSGDEGSYQEWITISTGTSTVTYSWERFGSTHLPDMNNQVKNKSGHSGGTAGNFAYADTGTIAWGTHTKATVLKSDVIATVPKPSGTTKYLKLTPTTGTALTGLGDPSTDTFVKSYPGSTSKLTTTFITGVQSSTTTASKATAGTAVAVAKAGTAVTVASGSLGTETDTRTANTPMWGATVVNETLSFTFKPLSTTSVTPAVSNGSITPYTFADVTVPIKNTSATTVATGAVAAGSSGASVMTGLGTPTTASAVTDYPNPTTDTFIKSETASTTTTSTDGPAVITAVSTSGTNNVTFNTSGHTAEAITALGSATVNPV